ncbi:SDR family NAD(P)-dependent oxidoreductase [Acinetobacter baumannii]
MTKTSHQFSQSLIYMLIGSAIILALSLGVRHGFGLYLVPMSHEFGWGQHVFSLAIAMQNLIWGAVQPFTGAIADKYGSLDVLINNAGLFSKTKQLTVDGFEQQFGVNYLGHFLLTQKLLPVLKQSPQARIIHLASIAHWVGSIKPNKFRAEGFYNPLFYYGQSKLANLLFSNALAEQLADNSITNNALHPGGVASDIYRDLPKPVYAAMKVGLVPTSVPAKLITEMATGDTWQNRNGEYVSAHMPDWKSSHAKNQQLARDLYQQSMTLVEKFL